jgi:hypothetical protein
MNALIVIGVVIAAIVLWPRISAAIPGLGTTAQQASAAASLASASTGSAIASAVPRGGYGNAQDVVLTETVIANAGQALNSVVPGAGIVGSAIAKAIGVLGSIFKGADPTQVVTSEIEQVYEICADYICRLGGVGTPNADNFGGVLNMLPASLVAQALSALIQGATQAELKALAIGKASQQAVNRGITNLTMVIQAELSGYQHYRPEEPNVPVSIAAAHTTYLQAPGGWYRNSVTIAGQLCDAFLAQLPQGVILHS